MEELRAQLRVPAICPVCSGFMKGKSTFTWYDYGCCVECYIFFLEERPARIEAWKAGWRPSEAEVEAKREAFKV
jgi:hypothetical protein